MGTGHLSGMGQGAMWFPEDFKADQSNIHYRGYTMAACLLIHSLQMQILLLTSKLYCSCTTCSYLRVTDFCTIVAWDWGLHIIFMFAHYPYWVTDTKVRSTDISGVFTDRGLTPPTSRRPSTSQRHYVAALILHGPVHSRACLAWICQCEDNCVTHRKSLIPRFTAGTILVHSLY